MKSFSHYMLKLAHRHSISNVFRDFLEIAVCALAQGSMEKEYFEVIKRYEKSELLLFTEAFAALIIEMDNKGNGLLDIFGDFFMEHISHGHNGQFFTPQPICDMLSAMTTEKLQDGQRILDPACGSGRTLLASAKINRNALFYGADVDRTCSMMCLINLCLNNLKGEVAWMNSLSNEFYGGWQVRRIPFVEAPYIHPITEEESYIVLRKPFVQIEEQKKVPAFDFSKLPEIKIEPARPVQQLLFNF